MMQRQDTRALFAGAVRPVDNVFDISVREAGTTSVYGQSARSMLRAYELARQMGFRRTQIASLSFGARYTVQDQFIELLRQRGDDLAGAYVSFGVHGAAPALEKIRRYGVQNVFIDMFVGDAGGRFDPARAAASADLLCQVLDQVRALLPAAAAAPGGLPVGEIFINFGDFAEQRAHWDTYFSPLFARVRRHAVQAICFEEFRGAALPENMFEAAAYLRAQFGFASHQIYAHIHGGNGLDDACNLAAVAGGADGVWAAMTPTSALAGHGSSLVYLTNLFRYGNRSVTGRYRLALAHDIVTELYALNHAGNEPMPIEMPVFGRNAYAVNFQPFSQQAALPGMLPAALVGRVETARFVPLLSDPASIRQRLAELGAPAVDDATIERLQDTVHRHLLDDLGAGAGVDTRIDFNAPAFLLSFLAPRRSAAPTAQRSAA